MNDGQDYKLFHLVDPTKIRIPFNERFAKLTLSSNKKKAKEQQQVVDEDVISEEKQQLLRKRSSASCNLLKLLNESEQQKQQQQQQQNHQKPQENINNSSNYVNNPLLRSDSSSRCSNEQLNENAEEESEISMEALEVSFENNKKNIVNDSIVQQQIELLSQKVSTMTMKNEYSNVSMNIPEEECSIVLSSDTTQSESDDVSIIVISDTSQSASAQSYQTTMGFDGGYVPVSWLSDNASSLNLPQQQQKDMLMAAFLNDVSQAQKQGILDESMPIELTKAQMLAAADTESMTMTEYDEEVQPVAKPIENNLLYINSTQSPKKSSTLEISFSLTTQSDAKANSPLKKNNANALAEDETELNTLNSFIEDHNNSGNQQNSQISNDSATVDGNTTKVSAVDSLIISETSSENIRNEQSDEQENVEEEVPAATTTEPTSLSSRETLSTGTENVSAELSSSEEVTISSHINISAKISVKIQIQQTSSEDEHFNTTEGKSKPSLPSSSESRSPQQNTNSIDNNNKVNNDQIQLKNTEVYEGKEEDDEIIRKENVSKQMNCLAVMHEEEEEAKEEHFMTHAEKVLSEIYGNKWRTPQMLRTLKTASANKNCSSEQRQPITTNETEVSMSKRDTEVDVPDDSMLHDFSIFRRNIVKTNLDSTRLVTPKLQQQQKPKPIKTQTEPKLRNYSNFKTPCTASNRRQLRPIRQRPIPLHLENRFRQIVDSDSGAEEENCVNASDDSDVDKTYDDSSSEQKSSSEEEDERNTRTKSRGGKENTAPKTRTRVRNNKKKNNQNDLVYLDLTKEEVVVQSSPESSPLANRDANFDKRLQDILRSCRVEEKSKIPVTPKSTSKRKLFTPNFGMENEASVGDGKSETPQRKLPPLTLSDRLLLDEEELAHFQGPALPPGLQIYNKPLESVKKGKPIFKITTPKRKQNAPTAKTTPLTTVAKVDKEQLSNTPDMKYSFLKSLDVCVSKSYCNTEALQYRDNYRQKKEELSQKLYNLYNVELFDNKLDVPLKWNKKLLNTAGRCLNKKR